MNKRFWIALNVIVIVALTAGLLGSIAYFSNQVNDLQFQIDVLTGAVNSNNIITFSK